MDILDILHVKDEHVLSGTYRDKKNSEAFYIDYEIVTEPVKEYGKIINNLIYSDNSQVMKTCGDFSFKIRGYVSTQDGELWQIIRIQKIVLENKEVLRICKENPKTDYILGLLKVDNPMGID